MLQKYYFVHTNRLVSSQAVERVCTRLDQRANWHRYIVSHLIQNGCKIWSNFFGHFFVSVPEDYKILEGTHEYYMTVYLVLLELAGPGTFIDLKMTPKICKFWIRAITTDDHVSRIPPGKACLVSKIGFWVWQIWPSFVLWLLFYFCFVDIGRDFSNFWVP